MNEEALDQLVAQGDDPFDPAYEAYKLRLKGADWQTISEQTGYSNRTSCQVAVKNYLERAAVERSAEKKREVLELEIARLDALQEAYWDAAMKMDDKAAQIVLKTMQQRAKLRGLEQPDEKNSASKTILVSGRNYNKMLQEIAAGQHDPDEDEDE